MPRHTLPFVVVNSDHGMMIVNRLDVHQLPNGATYGVGYQILNFGSFDPGEVEQIKQILVSRRETFGNGVVAIDCGANIGVMTIEMARLMRNWGEVHAFEPQERVFYALCGNIVLGNLFNAYAVQAAVGEFDGTISIPQPDYSRPASFGSLELKKRPDTEYIGQSISYAAKDLTKVSQVRLDSFLKVWPRVDFVKIDVEGMELDVLSGAKELFERFRPVALIEWIKCGQAGIRDFLVPLGYSISEAGGNLLAEPT